MKVNVSSKVTSSLRNIAEKYPIQKIVIFGSRARGDNHPKSDIDVAVFSSPGLDLKGHITCEIDDLETLLKIDIIFIDRFTDLKLLENIQKEGVVIYERLFTED